MTRGQLYLLRGLMPALAFLIPLPGRADQPASAAPPACERPDDSLIKLRDDYAGRQEVPEAEKIERYNAQGRAFNDCMKKLIETNNAEMDRIRNDGNAAIRDTTDSANRQSIAIAQKIKAAIAGHAAPDEAQTDWAGYPDADCLAADKQLLEPVRKGASTGAARSAKYYAQQQAYQACMKDYVTQAAAQMRQITTDADARIREIADTANARISQLHALVQDAIQTANQASASEVKVVRGTPLEINPGSSFRDGVESVIVEGTPPQIAETPRGEGDPHAIICRKPQQLPGSRLLGPEICKRNRVWASLYKAGKDLSADGQSIISSEKSRTFDRAALACVSTITGSPYSGYMTNTVCN
jgi:ElaB/YqjD/DUF883 family membrane-anchored ribosome-binding protein